MAFKEDSDPIKDLNIGMISIFYKDLYNYSLEELNNISSIVDNFPERIVLEEKKFLEYSSSSRDAFKDILYTTRLNKALYSIIDVSKDIIRYLKK